VLAAGGVAALSIHERRIGSDMQTQSAPRRVERQSAAAVTPSMRPSGGTAALGARFERGAALGHFALVSAVSAALVNSGIEEGGAIAEAPPRASPAGEGNISRLYRG
jgi:hypothetical protein